MQINMTPPVVEPEEFKAIDPSDLDPVNWDIAMVDTSNVYTFKQRETGRVVTDTMSAWKAMLKQTL
jgi:hypothetical protein